MPNGEVYTVAGEKPGPLEEKPVDGLIPMYFDELPIINDITDPEAFKGLKYLTKLAGFDKADGQQLENDEEWKRYFANLEFQSLTRAEISTGQDMAYSLICIKNKTTGFSQTLLVQLRRYDIDERGDPRYKIEGIVQPSNKPADAQETLEGRITEPGAPKVEITQIVIQPAAEITAQTTELPQELEELEVYQPAAAPKPLRKKINYIDRKLITLKDFFEIIRVETAGVSPDELRDKLDETSLPDRAKSNIIKEYGKYIQTTGLTRKVFSLSDVITSGLNENQSPKVFKAHLDDLVNVTYPPVNDKDVRLALRDYRNRYKTKKANEKEQAKDQTAESKN